VGEPSSWYIHHPLGGAHLRDLRQNSETASNLRLEVKKLASDSLLLILMTKDEKGLDVFKGFMLKNVLTVKKFKENTSSSIRKLSFQ
jgi:hypothetical protein